MILKSKMLNNLLSALQKMPDASHAPAKGIEVVKVKALGPKSAMNGDESPMEEMLESPQDEAREMMMDEDDSDMPIETAHEVMKKKGKMTSSGMGGGLRGGLGKKHNGAY